MTAQNDHAYWMAFSHLQNWGNESINRLIVEILHEKKISFSAFFSLDQSELSQEFDLHDKQIRDLEKTKTELPNFSFLAENLLEQGFQLIPFNSGEYSATLKQNLKTKNSPPLLYVKGNVQLLNETSVAIVGSRKATEIALEFTQNIAQKCAKNGDVVVSGFAKGVDKMALDATLAHHGRSIVVLPQGILTFGSGIKNYYKKIVAGDVLILSTYHPRAPWSVGMAMGRNIYIYGLAKKIFVAESDHKGGTWNGAIDGLKKGREIFVRQPGSEEKNANQLLILQGAVPVDLFGNPVSAVKIQIEHQLKELLSKSQLTAKAIHEKLELEMELKNLQQFLANLDFIDSKRVKNQKYYFLKNLLPEQSDLFS